MRGSISIKNLKDRKGKPLENIIAFWRRHKLLPFVESGQWMKVSFMQLIWIRILDDLRDINFPVEKMKLVCKYFFLDAYRDEVPKKNFEYNKKAIQQKKLAGTQTEEEDSLLQFIEDGLKNEPLMRILNLNVNYLSNFVAAVLANEKDGSIIIYFDGSVAEYVGDVCHSHIETIPDAILPHIKLSLGYYLKEFLSDEELAAIVMPQLLNEDEIKVLREMRRKNAKEITIQLEGQKSRIITVSNGKLTEAQVQSVKEIFGLKNYESITLDTIDEKSMSFKRIRKRI